MALVSIAMDVLASEGQIALPLPEELVAESYSKSEYLSSRNRKHSVCASVLSVLYVAMESSFASRISWAIFDSSMESEIWFCPTCVYMMASRRAPR